MNLNSKTKRSTASSSLNNVFNRLKRSKSTDKSTKYSNSVTERTDKNQMESHYYYYDKSFDIKADLHKHKNLNASSVSPVVSEEEIKSLSSSSKSPQFPSLPDVILRKLQLLRENSCSLESLTEQEVESKFATLSIAFKTDKQTLDQRVSHHKHKRDVSEVDAQKELKSLRDYVQQLNRLIASCDDLVLPNFRPELKDLLHKIETQVDVIGHTNAKISSNSELYGAVKQEERMSSTFDVVLLYSENLIRAHDRDVKELEKTKKLLNTNGHKKTDFDTDSDNESVPMRRSIRSISTTVIPKMNLIRVRRSSVSSIEILPNLDTHRKSVQPTVGTRYVPNSTSYLMNRSRRCSMPVTPAMTRSRTGADPELSLLEITTEEKADSDSDSSALTNEASDEEQSNHSKGCIKLSEEMDSNSSNASEQNNNSLNVINNNIYNEIISHRFNHEMNGHESDNSSSGQSIQKNKDLNNDENEIHNKLINIIEYNHLIKLFSFCSDGRLTSYVRRLLHDMRFILAVVLLMIAMVIIIWSVLPTGIPCECQCTYSWNGFPFKRLFAHLFD